MEKLNDEELALVNLVRQMRNERHVGNITLNFYDGMMPVVQVLFSYKGNNFIKTFSQKNTLTK
jgi:hypothetical protein